MRQILTIATLVLVAAVLVSCQLNDLLPRQRGRGSFKNNADNGLLKTFIFDKASLNERPGTKNGYLPPEPPTYLPPEPPTYLPPGDPPKISTSTNGPTYLPPSTTRPPVRNYTYMPTMGTFPPTRNYTYTTRQTTTYRPIKVPITFAPLKPVTFAPVGYNYDKPKEEFIIEDLKRSKF